MVEIKPEWQARDGDRWGIVVSQYNAPLPERLLRGAQAALIEGGVAESQIDVVWVAGAWEIPLLLDELASSLRYAGLVALGVVIRGRTTHDRYINRFMSQAIGRLGLHYRLPIGFGVLTCQTEKQAARRADPEGRNKGGEAARAALQSRSALRRLAHAAGSEAR